MNLYNAEGGDVGLRAETFAKYFPDAEFENFSPYFEDDELMVTAQDLYEGKDTVEEPLPYSDEGGAADPTEEEEGGNLQTIEE